MPDPTYELWCLFQRDSVLFPVTTSPTTSIGILKKQIKVEGERTLFSGIDALSLNLWQADVDYPEIKNKVRKGEYVFDTGEKEPLEEMNMVSDVWPQPPSRNQIHIYITLRPGMSLTLDQRAAPKDVDYPWLEELRSKIWKKKQLERDLFREVKVTQAHFIELQDRLKAQHPDRCSPEYDGDHDVLRVKLDVLHFVPKKEDSSKMDVDGPEASDGDDYFFPFTLRFLDLSTLDLKNMPGPLPPLLFLRQEYNEITTLIGSHTHVSFVVSGQPGTGKTMYLHLRVIQYMIEGRAFLYQAQNKIVYHVNEEGVNAISSWPSDEDIVAFVDADGVDYEPDYMLRKSSVQIILAASPKGGRSRWAGQMRTGLVKRIATDLWSPRELFIAGVFLHRLDISPELLWESISYFGCNPRHCFISARSVNALHTTKEDVASKITSINFKEQNMLQLLYAARTGDSAVSHSIFQIFPKDELRLLSGCRFKVVSDWAFRLSMEEHERYETHKANDFYRQILGMPKAASLWGYVFEQKVLHHIDTCGCNFEIRGLASPGKITWRCPSPIRRYNFLHGPDFIREITQAIKENTSLHLVPSVSNFEAVDSVLYSPNEVLTCIQTTVSGKHHISVPGLQRLQHWLGPKTPLAHLRPSSNRPWRFIFIVPPGDASTYEKQELTAKADTESGEWDSKVHQYVLGLDVLEKIPEPE